MISIVEIKRRLADYEPGSAGRHLAADDYSAHPQGLKPAAVLIALIAHAETPTMLMTVRNANMKRHPGQVAFPGGRADPGETAVETALREAEEEVALSPSDVEVIGRIDDYATGTGYRITPIIGVVPPGLTLTPREEEVSETFELPLSRALGTRHHIEDEAEWGGRMRRYFRVDWQPQNVWGATAGIIVNLTRILESRK